MRAGGETRSTGAGGGGGAFRRPRRSRMFIRFTHPRMHVNEPLGRLQPFRIAAPISPSLPVRGIIVCFSRLPEVISSLSSGLVPLRYDTLHRRPEASARLTEGSEEFLIAQPFFSLARRFFSP